MYIEALLITQNQDETSHLSVIGADFSEGFFNVILRPYTSSKTYENLMRTGKGIVLITNHSALITELIIDKNRESNFGNSLLRQKEMRQLNLAYNYSEFIVTSVVCNESIRSIVYAECLSWYYCNCINGINRAKCTLIEVSVLLSRDNMIRGNVDRWILNWYNIVMKVGDLREKRMVRNAIFAMTNDTK